MQESKIEIRPTNLAMIARESWRMKVLVDRLGDRAGTAGLRHCVRRLLQALNAEGVSFVDLKDQVYDPGVAVEVLDTEGEPTAGAVRVVGEVLAPIILHSEKLLMGGEVILAWKVADTAGGHHDEDY